MKRLASENNNLDAPGPAKVVKTGGPLPSEYPNVPGVLVSSQTTYTDIITKMLNIIRKKSDSKCGCVMLTGNKLWVVKYPMFICIGQEQACLGVFGIKYNIPPAPVRVDSNKDTTNDDDSQIYALADDLINKIISGPSAPELRTYLLNIYYKVSTREYKPAAIRTVKETMARKLADEFPNVFLNNITKIDFDLMTKSTKTALNAVREDLMKYVSGIRKHYGATEDYAKFRDIVIGISTYKDAIIKLFEFPGLNQNNIVKLRVGLSKIVGRKYHLDATWATFSVLPLHRNDITDQEFLDKFITKCTKINTVGANSIITGVKSVTPDEIYKEGLALEWEQEDPVWKKCLEDVKVIMDAIDKVKNN